MFYDTFLRETWTVSKNRLTTILNPKGQVRPGIRTQPARAECRLSTACEAQTSLRAEQSDTGKRSLIADITFNLSLPF